MMDIKEEEDVSGEMVEGREKAKTSLVLLPVLEVKRAANSRIPLEDIHNLLTNIRLIVPASGGKFALDREAFTAESVVGETVDGLVEWINYGAGAHLPATPVKAPLRALYLRTRPASSCDDQVPADEASDSEKGRVVSGEFVYRWSVMELLRQSSASSQVNTDKDADSDTDGDEARGDGDFVLGLFEEWMVSFPTLNSLPPVGKKAQAAIKAGLSELAVARNAHILAALLATYNRLNLPQLRTTSPADLAPSSTLRTFLSPLLASKHVSSMAADPAVRRLFARLCRISCDVHSPAATQCLTDNLHVLLTSSSSSDARVVEDIEDGVWSVAHDVCVEKRPKCPACPLKSVCQSYKRHIADRLFLNLLVRAPSFANLTLSKACRDGLDCLLCSPDVQHLASNSQLGVAMLPIQHTRPRRHVFACLLENAARDGLFLPGEGVMRGDLSASVSAGSVSALQHVYDQLSSAGLAHRSNLLRVPALDSVRVLEDAIEVCYVYATELTDTAVSPFERAVGVWLDEGSVGRLQSEEDVRLVHNYWYWRNQQDSVATSATPVSTTGVEMGDAERLEYLWERACKRMGQARMAYPG